MGGEKLQSILSYLDEMERADSDLMSRLGRSDGALKTEGLAVPPVVTTLTAKKQLQSEGYENVHV